jgi:hypothetical protein
MRIFGVAIMVLTAVCVTWGQDTTTHTSPPLQVIKHSWEKVRLNWEKDPLTSPTGENLYEMRTRVSTERRQRSALEERSMSAAREEKQKPAPPPRYVFTYKLTVLNSAAKRIKELDWDYVSTDEHTGEVLGRREFTSLEKIGPGKRKELTVTVSAPPTSRISVYALGKNEGEGVVETIVIGRVTYDDGTTWEPNQTRKPDQ